MLVFCTAGYFRSANCIQELQAAVRLRKPLLTLVEPDATRGGVTRAEALATLQSAIKEGVVPSHLGLDGAAVADLIDCLFGSAPIEWLRIGAFQVRFHARTPSLH